MSDTIVSKQCFKCCDILPLDQFYRHTQTADGHLNKCKDCTKRDVSLHRQENIERIREYDRVRHKRAESVERRRLRSKKYRHADNARCAVRRALKRGDLCRQPCERCGSTVVDAHHPDYDKPLEVMWLCRSHHRLWHVENGPGKNFR